MIVVFVVLISVGTGFADDDEEKFVGDVSIWDSNVVSNDATLFPIGGNGQVNGNFIVDTDDIDSGEVQTGLRAQRRFKQNIDPLIPVGYTYFIKPGKSAPGLANWNFDFHVDLGSNKQVDGNGDMLATNIGPTSHTFGDFKVTLYIDCDPSVGNKNLFPLDLQTFLLTPTAVLLQGSQNIGFSFLNGICRWQTGLDFDPFATGQYEFVLKVIDDEDVVAQSSMIVQVGDVVIEDDDDIDDDDVDDDDVDDDDYRGIREERWVDPSCGFQNGTGVKQFR